MCVFLWLPLQVTTKFNQYHTFKYLFKTRAYYCMILIPALNDSYRNMWRLEASIPQQEAENLYSQEIR